ncbi:MULTISPECIES: YdaS family helix-turn-helix protein [Vibrio]|uniref:YdaS family helix-turn-helix protein n=1 Tax=Vibrio TaxID=662 RepID=UPI001E45C3A4|nr:MULTISPECIES: YdaS family helix-turn-helix protein [Vibrio]MCC2521052.1 helix-turn-helix domain-containing protein [Vibrio coralliilyticus]MCG9678725.1 helix-turn-helix domain-containing protein [Vibrio sp. Isolate24]
MYANYWRQLDAHQRESLANKLNTNEDYLRQVLYGYRKAGAKLANKIHQLTQGEISKYKLRPEYF